jgi:lipopolysaccharide transport system ATP-binding protein
MDDASQGISNNYWDFENAPGWENIKVKSAYVQYKDPQLTVKTAFDIVTEFWCMKEGLPINVSMHLYDINGSCVFNISTINKPLEKGLHKAVFHIPANFMNDGMYYVNNMFVRNATTYFNHIRAHSFEIADERGEYGWYGKWAGTVRPTFIENEYQLIEPIE